MVLYLVMNSLQKINRYVFSTLKKQSIEKPKVFFVLGGPACGKGTQCLYMQETFNFKHISAGDCLREERSTGSKDADLINKHIADGTIVPNEITMKLLKKKMETIGFSNIFLIDGYPRNQENFEGWLQVMDPQIDFQKIVLFNTSDENLIQRGLKRAESQGRVDDNIEVIKRRIKIFQDETSFVVNHYRKQDKVIDIDGNNSREEVRAQIETEIKKLSL